MIRTPSVGGILGGEVSAITPTVTKGSESLPGSRGLVLEETKISSTDASSETREGVARVLSRERKEEDADAVGSDMDEWAVTREEEVAVKDEEWCWRGRIHSMIEAGVGAVSESGWGSSMSWIQS